MYFQQHKTKQTQRKVGNKLTHLSAFVSNKIKSSKQIKKCQNM